MKENSYKCYEYFDKYKITEIQKPVIKSEWDKRLRKEKDFDKWLMKLIHDTDGFISYSISIKREHPDWTEEQIYNFSENEHIRLFNKKLFKSYDSYRVTKNNKLRYGTKKK